jgi:hypothetical protein
VDVADVVDQLARALGVAARPGVVDEHVCVLGEVARVSGKDWTTVLGRSAALGDVIAKATERIDLLARQVEVVMDDEDADHVEPPA